MVKLHYDIEDQKLFNWESAIKEVDTTPVVVSEFVRILSGLDKQLGKFPIINFSSVEPLLSRIKLRSDKKYHSVLAKQIISTIILYHESALDWDDKKINLKILGYFGNINIPSVFTKRMEVLADLYRIKEGIINEKRASEMRKGPGGQGYYEAWLSLQSNKRKPMTKDELSGAILILSEDTNDTNAKICAQNDLKNIK